MVPQIRWKMLSLQSWPTKQQISTAMPSSSVSTKTAFPRYVKDAHGYRLTSRDSAVLSNNTQAAMSSLVWRSHTDLDFWLDGWCVHCLSVFFFFVCIFLENKTWSSGSHVAGLLRFSSVPLLTGSLHLGFTWVFVVAAKINSSPLESVAYLTKHVKHLHVVSEMTETHTFFLTQKEFLFPRSKRMFMFIQATKKKESL